MPGKQREYSRLKQKAKNPAHQTAEFPKRFQEGHAEVIRLTQTQVENRVDVWGFLEVSANEILLNNAFFEVVQPLVQSNLFTAEPALRAANLPKVLTQVSEILKLRRDEPSSALHKLSDRELEVFRLIGQGKGTRQIAEELNLTIATINSFRAHIKEKLQLKTSTEVMLHAIQGYRESVIK